MTVEFIARSMEEATAAIYALRDELAIAYEHLHAAEAERDTANARADTHLADACAMLTQRDAAIDGAITKLETKE